MGPFTLPQGDPEYPIEYVLDGQQRLTSIFGVFQSDLAPAGAAEWADIYFDLEANPDAQESQFVALKPDEVSQGRHFPLKSLFSSVDYRQATDQLNDEDVILIDKLQERFKEVRVPYQLLSTEDRAKVAIVFERINRTGVPLDTLQLLTAWTWSDEFDLQGVFEDLRLELEPFGFAEVSEDSNLLLRCCAAVLAGDASPATLVSLNGAEVRERFTEVANGIRGAIDFLRLNLHVRKISNLPFSTVLVPLCVFFAVPENKTKLMTNGQRSALLRWFWRTCFARRFSSGVLRNLKEDIKSMADLRDGKDSHVGSFTVSVDPRFFAGNMFRINSVNTKTFILMLAQKAPRSFVSGQNVSLDAVLRDYNRNEFHHLFPRSYLAQQGVPEERIGKLANFCFLSRADNAHLGGVAPSAYRDKMPANIASILDAAVCPEVLFEDDYDKFLKERSEALAELASEVMGQGGGQP